MISLCFLFFLLIFIPILFSFKQDGKTALMLASLNGKKDVVEILLSAKSEINLQSKVFKIFVWIFLYF